MTTYQHTQIGKGIVFLLIALALVNSYWAIHMGAAHAAIVPATVAIVMLITIFLFWKLTVTVNREVFRASFGLGLIYKQVPVNEIEGCEPIRIRWWYGWGIHLTPRCSFAWDIVALERTFLPQIGCSW